MFGNVRAGLISRHNITKMLVKSITYRIECLSRKVGGGENQLHNHRAAKLNEVEKRIMRIVYEIYLCVAATHKNALSFYIVDGK